MIYIVSALVLFLLYVMALLCNKGFQEKVKLKKARQQNKIYMEELTAMKAELNDNQELAGELMAVIEKIGYTYDVYGNRPDELADRVKTTVDEALSQIGFAEKARAMVDSKYPGMLDNLFAEFPKLNDTDRWIIILMCCNFSTSTICVMTKLTDVQLRNRKAELRKKLNSDARISIFLKERMKKYAIEDGNQRR